MEEYIKKVMDEYIRQATIWCWQRSRDLLRKNAPNASHLLIGNLDWKFNIIEEGESYGLVGFFDTKSAEIGSYVDFGTSKRGSETHTTYNTDLIKPAFSPIIRPVKAKSMSWIDKETNKRVFARATYGQDSKPFLRPALNDTFKKQLTFLRQASDKILLSPEKIKLKLK